MRLFHRCKPGMKINATHPLAGKTLYLPVMAEGASEGLASVFRWLGVEAVVTPPSDKRTLELGAQVTSGDECFPAKITFGDILRAVEQPGFDAAHAVIFMPTAEGPCRFGQYAPFLQKVLREAGYDRVQVISPSDKNGYADLGNISGPFIRMAWRVVVATDVLRRLLLKTRPYETTPGTAGRVYATCLQDLCATIEGCCSNTGCQLRALQESLLRSRERFRRVPARYDASLPLVGIVGEIFCRLNNFSNDQLVRRLEAHRAEAQLGHVGEWIWYTNVEQARRLRQEGQRYSGEMLAAKIRTRFQRADEQALLAPFHEDFRGYEEPEMEEVLALATPYLPPSGVLGEMVVSVGLVAWHARHGADGIIDISPFTCMNGIVSEAIYPRVSRDYGGIPIRNFYFDGTESDLDRDLGIYLELARSYQARKKFSRHYPACFTPAPSPQATPSASRKRPPSHRPHLQNHLSRGPHV